MARSKSSQKKAEVRAESSPVAPPTISARWLLTALSISLPAAALCTWAAFSLLFWQGSWQLLYHPASAITRTPSSIGLSYDPVSFATTEDGIAQLQGWWIPVSGARYTALYLHDQKGNLSDTVDTLANLHQSGLNVLAFDYRGYGQSHFEHPSEARWREDANWAVKYLTGTRHIDPRTIVIVGSGLGANLGLEIAAQHPEAAGVVLSSPVEAPANVIFNDPRAKLIPARLLVHDRYNLNAYASNLRIPSLWMVDALASASEANSAFEKVNAPKQRVLLQPGQTETQALKNWLNNIIIKE